MWPLLAKKALELALRKPAVRKALIAVLCLSVVASPFGVVTVMMLSFAGSASAEATPTTVPGISAIVLQAYAQAVNEVTTYVPKCTGMDWEILAAEAQVESSQMAGHTIGSDGTITPPIYGPALDGTDGNELIRDTGHDPLDGDSAYMRAAGPFQFLPTTWTAVRDQMGVDLGNPQNVFDASLTAAVYLCGSGRNLSDPTQLSDAIFQYNHSDSYVALVESWITTFTQEGGGGASSASTGSGKAAIIIATAEKYLGTPYAYGGGDDKGPTLGICDPAVGGGYLNGVCEGSSTVGFDCSGLTLYAYEQAGITLPRVAQEQYDEAPHKFSAAQGLSVLQPGDLVFFAYNTADPDAYYGNVHHVGIYLGGGQMIDSPTTGAVVRIEAVWLDQYSGGAQWW